MLIRPLAIPCRTHDHGYDLLRAGALDSRRQVDLLLLNDLTQTCAGWVAFGGYRRVRALATFEVLTVAAAYPGPPKSARSCASSASSSLGSWVMQKSLPSDRNDLGGHDIDSCRLRNEHSACPREGGLP